MAARSGSRRTAGSGSGAPIDEPRRFPATSELIATSQCDGSLRRLAEGRASSPCSLSHRPDPLHAGRARIFLDQDPKHPITGPIPAINIRSPVNAMDLGREEGYSSVILELRINAPVALAHRDGDAVAVRCAHAATLPGEPACLESAPQ